IPLSSTKFPVYFPLNTDSNWRVTYCRYFSALFTVSDSSSSAFWAKPWQFYITTAQQYFHFLTISAATAA
ncbi:hypothetical protein, partial [Rheinheimera sp.]|uniref:hypothetical protein n=1 Tax=Rheinheimera sp. TaxID=1869214 RepID=UPI0025E19E37